MIFKTLLQFIKQCNILYCYSFRSRKAPYYCKFVRYVTGIVFIIAVRVGPNTNVGKKLENILNF